MASTISSYRDLLVWQQGMDLAVLAYEITNSWPRDELYGLTSQVRRSAASIPANIAEGYGRESPASYQNFLRIAQGSTKELETHLLIASRIKLASEAETEPLLAMSESVGKLIRLLIRSLQNT